MSINSIDRKLSRVQAISAALFFVASLVSIGALLFLSETLTRMHSISQQELRAVRDLGDALAQSRFTEAVSILSIDKREEKTFARHGREVERQLATLSRLTRGDPVALTVDKLRTTWRGYRVAQGEFVGIVNSGRLSSALAVHTESLGGSSQALDALTHSVADQIRGQVNHRDVLARSLSLWASTAVGILYAICTAIALAMRVFVRRKITVPLAKITDSLTSLADGDLGVVVTGGGRDDEVGALVRALEIFRERAYDLQHAHRETQEAQAQAESLARHDPLTGLPNRRVLVELTQRLAEDPSVKPAAVLMLDLDRFKPINDVHGHEAGDHVLCALAERFDDLHSGATVARLGGDEFAVLLPLESGPEDAVRLCEAILDQAEAPIQVGDILVQVGCTVGIALFPEDGHDASSLLRAADLAMYEAKSRCKGSYRFFEASMQAEVERRAQFDLELQRAIAAGEIKPYYQPLVAIDGSEIVGFEILSRWEHPTRGIVLPDDFIPAAEERGLLTELTYSILRQACIDARGWPTSMRLSINLSPSQLRDPFLAPRMMAILSECQIHPSRIEVEVTENALIGDLEATKHVLFSLQNLGMTVALDDFGTGYSSLYHLRELRFDKIKVDKSFVQALDAGGEKSKIVRAMIGLGKSLGLSTTAEGIEDQEQWSQLAKWGCDFGQGYLFGKALPAVSVPALIADAHYDQFVSSHLQIA